MTSLKTEACSSKKISILPGGRLSLWLGLGRLVTLRHLASGVYQGLERFENQRCVYRAEQEVGAGRAVIAGHVELDADKDMDGVLVTITDEATGRVLGEWQADLKRDQSG